MSEEKETLPPGYVRNEHMLRVSIGGQGFAVSPRDLTRPFLEVLVTLRKISFEDVKGGSESYYRVMEQKPAQLVIESDDFLIYYGIPAVNSLGNIVPLTAQGTGAGQNAAQQQAPQTPPSAPSLEGAGGTAGEDLPF